MNLFLRTRRRSLSRSSRYVKPLDTSGTAGYDLLSRQYILIARSQFQFLAKAKRDCRSLYEGRNAYVENFFL